MRKVRFSRSDQNCFSLCGRTSVQKTGFAEGLTMNVSGFFLVIVNKTEVCLERFWHKHSENVLGVRRVMAYREEKSIAFF